MVLLFFVVKFPFFGQKSGLDALGGVIRFPKNGLVAKCAPTVGDPWEGQEPWENHGRTVGGPKEPWENRGDFTKNRGRTVGTKKKRAVGEPWGLYKEPWENRGDFTKNRGRTVGIQVLKSNDLVVTKRQNRGRTVGEPWGFSGEPWENRGDFPENRGEFSGEPWENRGDFRRTVGEPRENRGGKFENRGDPKWPPKPHAKKL